MSTTTIAPPVLIDAPVPQAPPFNLLEVAVQGQPGVFVDGTFDDHWRGGVFVRPYPSDVGDGQDPCELGTNRQKGTGETDTIPTFGAFTAFVSESCSSFGIYTYDDFMTRANRVMLAVQHHHAEKQLVVGAYKTDNPYLGDANVTALAGTVAGPTAQKSVEALALLEDAIALTARQGMIHATPSTIVQWSRDCLLEVRQGRLLTLGGTPVVRGTGYVDEKPDAAPALSGGDQAYAWATGPVLYRLGEEIDLTPPTIREALDRTTNEVVYRAERDMLVAWDTQLQASVLVDRSL